MSRNLSLHSGERQIGHTLDWVEAGHKWRYTEILPIVDGKRVLDVGCGVGYGSSIMGGTAKSVLGVDDSPGAIQVGVDHYQKENVHFVCSDFLAADVKEIDVIVAFEVIEHIEDTDAVFAKFKAICPEFLIISCPHTTTPMGGNMFHFRHYGMDELVDRFRLAGFRIQRAELMWFRTSLCNFMIGQRR